MEEDTTPAADICKELQLTAEALYEQTKVCDARYKELCEKIADKSSVTSSRILFPKTAAVSRWLKTLSLPQEIVTYDEFLNTFLDLYEKDGRLDFATRSLQLRPKDAKLFGLSADTPVTIFALLGALPCVFS